MTDDANIIESAEEAMMSFADARDSLPVANAAFGRAECWASGRNAAASLKQLDYFFLSAKDEHARLKNGNSNMPRSYFGFGMLTVDEISELTEKKSVGRRVWDQHLKIGSRTFRKWGFVNRFDSATVVDADGKLEGSDTNSKSILKEVDLFSLAVADYGSFQAGKVSGAFVLQFLANADLVRAAENSKYVCGVWHVRGKPGALATVMFDKAAEGMPVEIAWRQFSKDKGIEKSLDQNRIYSFSTTKWEQKKSTDTSFLVPVAFKVNAPGVSDLSTQSEMQVLVEWRFDQEAEKCMPKKEMKDWREPIRAVFDADFSVGFTEFRDEQIQSGTK
ncbi:MAG: hypothetical protein Aurels2KO_34600 [Aureliella sp.]